MSSNLSMEEQLEEAKRCFEKKYCTEAEYDKKRELIMFGQPVSSTGGSEGVLAKQFEAQELRNLQPWRVDLQRFQTIKADWAKMTKEQKQALFLRKAENQRLGATEAMLGMYLLYGSEADLDFFRSLLVSSSGEQRMFMHNMYVASNREEVFMLANGHKIAHLTSPLFPAFEQYHLLNDMLLAEDPVSGGGSGEEDLQGPGGGGSTGGWLVVSGDSESGWVGLR
jgi:hypothetical protein